MAAWMRVVVVGCWLAGVGVALAQDKPDHDKMKMKMKMDMDGQLPPPRPQEPLSPIGLEELEGLALARNPTLQQAAAQIAAARGRALQAGLCLNPEVGYIGDLMGTSGTAGEFQGGYVQQTIVTGGKLRLSRAKYNQEAYEAEILATAQQMRVLNGVRLRYYDLLALQRMLDLARLQADNAREHQRTRKEQLNSGQTTRTNALLAEVESNRADIHVRTIENRHRAAWQHLIALVNAPELCAGRLAGTLEPDGPPLDFECSLEILLRDSPVLQAAHAHAVHDQIMVERERRQPIPNVTVQAAAGNNFETNNTVASVQVGFNLPVFDRNQGTVRQAQADLARSLAEIQRVELMLRKQLADVFMHYETAYQTVQLFRESSLPKMEEAYKVQQEMYKERRLPWIEVVATQKELLALRAEYTQALRELREAEVAIRGLLLVDGLTEPAPPLPGGHIDSVPKPR